MNRNDLLIIAKPIQFNDDLVIAIKTGQKTTFRKLIKTPPPNDLVDQAFIQSECPYAVGDILYLRETFLRKPDIIGGGYMYRNDTVAADIYKWEPSVHMPKDATRTFLKITDIKTQRLHDMSDKDALAEGVHMIQDGIDIGRYSYEQSPKSGCCWATAVGCFEHSIWWPSLKLSERNQYSWTKNPLVWVLQFEIVICSNSN